MTSISIHATNRIYRSQFEKSIQLQQHNVLDSELETLNADGTNKTIAVENRKFLLQRRKKCCQYFLLIFGICLIISIALCNNLLQKESSNSNQLSNAGMIGLWPTFGGTLQNQQKPPSSTDIKINIHNVHKLKMDCIYDSPDGFGFTGFPAIDNDYNAYFTDMSGYITSINLNTCHVNWRSHIGTLLGKKRQKIISYQSLTLFQDSNGTKGALFGAPQSRIDMKYAVDTVSNKFPCYAIAIHLNNGSSWWNIEIGKRGNKHDYKCSTHGFFVDGHFAYGGMAQSAGYDATHGSKFVGRYIKIDIDSHEIVNTWYPYNIELTDIGYAGVSAYNFPAITPNKDYLVFGTSNMHRVPKYIDDCLTFENKKDGFNEFLLLNNSQHIDICGNDQSHNRFWRCLETNVFVDSLIVLNKTNFELLHGFPLQGCDVYYNYECNKNPLYSEYCPSINNQGVNGDLTAVAIFKNKFKNNKLYVVASQKTARLHIFELETGKLMISRKFGPGSVSGQFGIAVDEDSMIGITSYTAKNEQFRFASYKLANNLTVCDGTSTIHAFDLNTGNILWQIVNPYGTINESKCFESNYSYIDYSRATTCEYGNFLPAYMTAYDKVIIPPKSNHTFTPINAKARAMFRAPVTIVNGLVFIGGSTGDIWVHHLINGSFISHFTCPNVFNKELNQYNRPGIKGGISIVNDRIVFYCGLYWEKYGNGSTFVSMKL